MKGAKYVNNLVVKSAHPTSTKSYAVDAVKFPKLATKIAAWAAMKTDMANNSSLHELTTTPIDGEGESHKVSTG